MSMFSRRGAGRGVFLWNVKDVVEVPAHISTAKAGKKYRRGADMSFGCVFV